MIKHLSAAAVVLLLGPVVDAQDRARWLTRPAVPSQAALDRLNLKLAWYTYVPTDGGRDGIFSVQVLNDQILVQTRSGIVVSLNPDDGTQQWRNLVGTPYRVTQPPGRNARSVFALNGARVYALDRKNGALQWSFDPPMMPAAPPVADDERLYLPLGTGRLFVYQLPRSSEPGQKPVAPVSVSGTGESYAAANEPNLLWDYEVDGRLEQAPLMWRNLLVLADNNGTFFTNSKYNRTIEYRFQADAPLAAPLAQHGGIAYVASREFNVFALDIEAGHILWRFTADRPILRKPMVTDEDIYISPVRAGMYRVNRQTGQEVWHTLEASLFLAHNKVFVYAMDRQGHLLILDRATGRPLTRFDFSAFVFPVSNELTDRIFLASNNGLLICLHDKNYRKPYAASVLEEPKPAAEEKKPAAAPEDQGEKKSPADKGAEVKPEK
jgi:outer membrane protein assembly factor BamB